MIHLGEELPRWSSTLSIQKKHAIKPQSIRKSTTATENQAQKTKQKKQKKKTDAIFVKEAHIENASLAIITFLSYLHALQ